jgi:chromate transporter
LAAVLDVFLAFVRVGAFGFGGGPSMLPLVRAEVVDRHHWLDDGQFAEALAAGNALPGPIATKLAAYVGWKVAGAGGAVAGLVGVAVPTAVLMVALMAIASRFADEPHVRGAMKAVRPVVLGMMVWVVIELFPDSGGAAWAVVVAAGTAAALASGKVHPAVLIGVAAAVGAVFRVR